jgi:hypothetical protein
MTLEVFVSVVFGVIASICGIAAILQQFLHNQSKGRQSLLKTSHRVRQIIRGSDSYQNRATASMSAGTNQSRDHSRFPRLYVLNTNLDASC